MSGFKMLSNVGIVGMLAIGISAAMAAPIPEPPRRPAELTNPVNPMDHMNEVTKPVEVNGCGARELVEKVLQQGEFVVLVRGHGQGIKVVETWINSKGSVMTVSYDEPADKQQTSIKTVCVDSIATKSVYNGDTVEILYKALEKNTKDL